MRYILIRWLRYALKAFSRAKIAVAYPTLREVLGHYKDSESLAIDASDALALYEHVLRRRPKCILELGPGTSTAVIAQAILDVGIEAEFLSVDDSEEWLQYHIDMLPDHLRELVSIEWRECDTEAIGFQSKAAYFKDLPEKPYDFIHVDGPNNTRFGAEASSDVARLKPKNCLVVFDGRQLSAYLTAERLGLGRKYNRNPYSLNPELQL